MNAPKLSLTPVLRLYLLNLYFFFHSFQLIFSSDENFVAVWGLDIFVLSNCFQVKWWIPIHDFDIGLLLFFGYISLLLLEVGQVGLRILFKSRSLIDFKHLWCMQVVRNISLRPINISLQLINEFNICIDDAIDWKVIMIWYNKLLMFFCISS